LQFRLSANIITTTTTTNATQRSATRPARLDGNRHSGLDD
jgi:hypothetical protein